MTGNVTATYLYRREIAQAISRYSSSIKQIFKAHGSPIPPSPECAGAMGNAWGTCRVDFFKADQMLTIRRGLPTECVFRPALPSHYLNPFVGFLGKEPMRVLYPEQENSEN